VHIERTPNAQRVHIDSISNSEIRLYGVNYDFNREGMLVTIGIVTHGVVHIDFAITQWCAL